MADCHFTPA